MPKCKILITTKEFFSEDLAEVTKFLPGIFVKINEPIHLDDGKLLISVWYD